MRTYPFLRLLPLAFLWLGAPAFSQQAPSPTAAPQRRSMPDTSIDKSPAAAQVLALDKKIGEAIVAGDTAFMSGVLADDFRMTHSDRWITGDMPLLTDNKQSFLRRVTEKSYLTYDLYDLKVEMHSDMAIVYGRYVASMKNTPPERAWFSVWFEHIYVQRNGNWIYLSHRTLQGANYGPDRNSVMLLTK